jgi:hypothetical protein
MPASRDLHSARITSNALRYGGVTIRRTAQGQFNCRFTEEHGRGDDIPGYLFAG